jgi:hypothetical protein
MVGLPHSIIAQIDSTISFSTCRYEAEAGLKRRAAACRRSQRAHRAALELAAGSRQSRRVRAR